MSTDVICAPARAPGSVRAFVAVALLVASSLMTVLGILTVGVFVAPLVILSAALLAREGVRCRVGASSAAGALAGLAVLPGWFGYLSAGHPGIPDQMVDSGGLPGIGVWIGAVAVLIAAAIALFVLLGRATVRARSSTR